MKTLNSQKRSTASCGVIAVALIAVVALVAACGSSDSDESASTTSVSGPLAAPAISEAPTGDLPEATQASLQAALETSMAEYDVPGAVVGVWVPGQGAWVTAAGLADVETGTPASTDMTWPLRSVTKSYTVTLILQLVDEGKVTLDDTIDQYVDGVTDGDKITLRQLANMSSGNADYTNDAFIDAFVADPTKIFTIDELNGFMLGLPAEFAPGSEYVYTNANTNLLGAVVEKVTGQPFKDVLDEKILAPLDLQDTSYTVDVADWAQPHPLGYVPEDGVMTAQDQNLSILGAAGSMLANVYDQRVWGEALATGALLTAETQAERLQGHPLEVGPPYDEYALGIGETSGWWGHNGEGIGFTAAVFHNPETGATIVVYTNTSNNPEKFHPADQTFRALAEVLKGA